MQVRPRRYLLVGAALLLLLLNALMVRSILFSGKGMERYVKLGEQVAGLEAANLDLNRENARLYDNITRMKSDRAFQERVVRENLGWTGKNELVVEFPPSPEKTAAASPL